MLKYVFLIFHLLIASKTQEYFFLEYYLTDICLTFVEYFYNFKSNAYQSSNSKADNAITHQNSTRRRFIQKKT